MKTKRNLAIGLMALLLGPPAAGSAAAKPSEESKQLRRLVASDADFTRGVAAQRRGDLTLAAESYEKAIRTDGDFVEAMVNLARVQLERGRLDTAAGWIDRAEALRRDYPGVHAARGLLALRRGDVGVAVDALSEARSLAPDDVEVLVNLGAALLERGFAREAIEVSLEAQRLDAGRAETHFNLGLAHDRTGEIQAAQYHYRRFLDQSRDDDPSRLKVENRLAELVAAHATRPENSTVFDSRIGRSDPISGGKKR